jgi:hypothetical protein
MSRTKKLFRGLGAASVLSLGFGTIAGGCLNRPIDTLEPKTTSTVVERLAQNGVDKIDLLLAIDNSISMSDKQAILRDAVPDLVDRLVTPICVDDNDMPNGESVDAAGECADGFKPEFPPIRNINVGIISSSLGDLTTSSCAGVADADDQAHLLDRGGAGTVETYQGKHFLAWDPDGERDPVGINDSALLKTSLGEMVVGVGQTGCGYEMQLESILRFLVDPDPYESLVNEGSKLAESGTDQVILQQRSDFLRADSLLAIIILSDENDCSVDLEGSGYLTLRPQPFYKATSECEDDPNDECCKSCKQNTDGKCDAGGACVDGENTFYSAVEDSANLRCYNQKQRYGVNFLYPVQRYINAFTQTSIDPGAKDYFAEDPDKAETNPLFKDLSADQSAVSIRSPDLVFVAGIVGVPWQAIARRNEAGDPDLTLGFKRASELKKEELDAMIGDPDKNEPPTDPFMIESVAKRSGTSTLVGATLPGANDINGNDYNIPDNDNLQFACIFELNDPQTGTSDCDCTGAGCDSPLCDPNDLGSQINAKGYPGLRELAFLRGMGTQGIFASICPAKALTSQQAEPDYGYRPAVNAIIDRLKEELGGQCLARELKEDPQTKEIPCLVLEASHVNDACNCEGTPGRIDIPKEKDGEPNAKYNAVLAAQEDEGAPTEEDRVWNCFCEIVQLAADEKDTCRTVEDPQANAQGDGWCYIDPAAGLGNPAIVADCSANERRLVRFVGEGEPLPGATVFVTCAGEN